LAQFGRLPITAIVPSKTFVASTFLGIFRRRDADCASRPSDRIKVVGTGPIAQTADLNVVGAGLVPAGRHKARLPAAITSPYSHPPLNQKMSSPRPLTVIQLTPPGRGAVATLRVEGTGVIEAVQAFFRARSSRQVAGDWDGESGQDLSATTQSLPPRCWHWPKHAPSDAPPFCSINTPARCSRP
jgi:hypothetical protein